MGQLGPREALAKKYQATADFLFVYTREAHPGKPLGSLAMSPNAPPAYDQTTSWQDRAGRARAFAEKMSVARPMLVDEDGDDSVLQQYGGHDNQLIVIDDAGQIILKQERTDDTTLDEF